MDALATYDSDTASSSSPPPPPHKQPRRRTPSPPAPAPKKRKRLPAPPPSLTPPAPPPSNPAQHAGRTRTHPHVDGQFAAHVYVRVALADDAVLRGVVREVGGGGHSCLEDGDEDGALHISLSRPIYLRAHQRAALRTAVRALAGAHAPFPASFASFAALPNDTRTRAFLALEVGAGHAPLRALAEGLAPTLRTLRQQPYYAQPRFHASVVWALMREGTDQKGEDEDGGGQAVAVVGGGEDADTPLHRHVPALRASLGARLRRAGTFVVDALHVRIGRDVHVYPLRGGAGV